MQPKLEFDVIDSGIGMTDQQVARIFEPFVQADSSVTRRFGGTGLGLSISQKIIEALDGTLTAKSVVGNGSVFTGTIRPCVDRANLKFITHDEFNKFKKATQVARKHDEIELSQGRILVVNDGDANRRLISLILTRAGCDVEQATNGQEAIEMADRSQFDLILMDMQMPVLDGYSATKLLREQGFKQPIIALTANAMQGDEEKCLSAGCSGFLTKPVNMDRLLESVHDALAGTEQYETSMDEHFVEDHQNVDEIHANVDENRLEDQISHNEISKAEKTQQEELFDGTSKKPHCTADQQAANEAEFETQSAEIESDIKEPNEQPKQKHLEGCFDARATFHSIFEIAIDAMLTAWNHKDYVTLAEVCEELKDASLAFGIHNVALELDPVIASATKGEHTELVVTLRHFEQTIQPLSRVKFTFGPYAQNIEPKSETPTVLYDSDEPLELSVGRSQELNDKISRHQVEPTIECTLPVDDAEFEEIVHQFLLQLNGKLHSMDHALQNHDYHQLASDAHWLKGAGGTCGFPAFFDPSCALEQAANIADQAGCEAQLGEIKNLTSRLHLAGSSSNEKSGRNVPATSADDNHSTLPIDVVVRPKIRSRLPIAEPEFREIVVDFVDQLEKKIIEIKQACQDAEFDTLAEHAHWLKGAGGTCGFSEFFEPSLELEQGAKSNSLGVCKKSVQMICEIAEQIDVPETSAV